MSKNQKAAVVLLAAVAGQAYLGKVAKQQAAVLGLSAVAVMLLGLAVGAAL
ncbi:hypothetical protein J7E87_10460 [Streptomyces sp. ISL-1]|uniref:hypothetical protein n=1 Tax=Streptomyces sp. ISL-1 TaxID=2817657 RepID=UPI001BE82F18|nr:hypothetical protein [Streptomyces sp. ISL-1]MBT2389843.1 hypothetical protein [Streptomyces sp. ISL-1]